MSRLRVSASHSLDSEGIPSEPYSLQGSINKDLTSRLKKVKVLTEDAGLKRNPD